VFHQRESLQRLTIAPFWHSVPAATLPMLTSAPLLQSEKDWPSAPQTICPDVQDPCWPLAWLEDGTGAAAGEVLEIPVDLFPGVDDEEDGDNVGVGAAVLEARVVEVLTAKVVKDEEEDDVEDDVEDPALEAPLPDDPEDPESSRNGAVPVHV